MKILFLVVLSCLLFSEEPEWFSNRPVEEGALYGIGVCPKFGSDANLRSRNNALVDISSQLIVSIKSSSETEKSSKRSTSIVDGKTTKTKDMKVDTSKKIVSKTEVKFLTGVEVVASEVHGVSIYTLVRLDKQLFIENGKKRVKAIDRIIVLLKEPMSEITGERIIALRRALPLVKERGFLSMMLTGQGQFVPDPPIDYDVVLARLGYLSEEASLFVVGADKAPAVESVLANTIGDLGITIADSDNANFGAKLKELKEIKLVQGWTRMKLIGSVAVSFRDTGEVLGSFETSVSANSTVGEDDAYSRCRVKLISKMSKDLKNKLLPLLIGNAKSSK